MWNRVGEFEMIIAAITTAFEFDNFIIGLSRG
jgi:hypothetical protein